MRQKRLLGEGGERGRKKQLPEAIARSPPCEGAGRDVRWPFTLGRPPGTSSEPGATSPNVRAPIVKEWPLALLGPGTVCSRSCTSRKCWVRACISGNQGPHPWRGRAASRVMHPPAPPLYHPIPTPCAPAARYRPTSRAPATCAVLRQLPGPWPAAAAPARPSRAARAQQRSRRAPAVPGLPALAPPRQPFWSADGHLRIGQVGGWARGRGGSCQARAFCGCQITSQLRPAYGGGGAHPRCSAAAPG